MKQVIDEQGFIKLWHQCGGSASEVAKALGVSERSVYSRRARIEAVKGIAMESVDYRSTRKKKSPVGRENLEMQSGTILIGSDAHIWPGELTTAQRGFLHFAKLLKPDIICMNGDVYDGARISRHPSGIWSQQERPTVKQELDACQEFLDKVVKATTAKRYWCLGNHDMRFEMRLSAMIPEFEKVTGFSLKDHFPEWKFAISLWVNDVVIKHRAGHSGLHAVYQNTLKGGKSVITGHLHSLKVTPWTDWGGDRYGVDCGTLADIDSEQFNYTEDNAKNWRSGFVLLTFDKGRLLYPEVAQVLDEDEIQFRGKVYRV